MAAADWRLVAFVVVALVVGAVLGAVLAWFVRARHRRWSVAVYIDTEDRQGPQSSRQ